MGGDGFVVLLSGGVDSSTLLHRVVKEKGAGKVCAISFSYGQKHSRELEMARWQAEVTEVVGHRVIEMGSFAEMTAGASALTDEGVEVPALKDIAEEDLVQPVTYVPNRNMVLLSLAAAFAESVGANKLYYGAQAQDEYGYWDCTVGFVEAINKVLSLNRKSPVEVMAPFAEMKKSEVVKMGMELGVDYGHTWTCYRGAERVCGECPSCVERQVAFSEAGVVDPLSE